MEGGRGLEDAEEDEQEEEDDGKEGGEEEEGEEGEDEEEEQHMAKGQGQQSSTGMTTRCAETRGDSVAARGKRTVERTG